MKLGNPFRMFGSYIGLVIGLIGSYWSFLIIFYLAETGRFRNYYWLIMLVPLIIGFLLGWIVHSFIREFLRKNFHRNKKL
jgi:hypothetical protein